MVRLFERPADDIHHGEISRCDDTHRASRGGAERIEPAGDESCFLSCGRGVPVGRVAGDLNRIVELREQCGAIDRKIGGLAVRPACVVALPDRGITKQVHDGPDVIRGKAEPSVASHPFREFVFESTGRVKRARHRTGLAVEIAVGRIEVDGVVQFSAGSRHKSQGLRQAVRHRKTGATARIGSRQRSDRGLIVGARGM